MNNKIIQKIKISKLFGLYTYSLPKDVDFLNAAILYGDNGVGKSTVLRLAFHLLSAANDRGHRTALYNAKFESLQIDLSSGHVLDAIFKHEDNVKILCLTIKTRSKTLATWEYAPKNSRAELSAMEEVFTISPDGNFVMRRKKNKAVPKDVGAWGEKSYTETLKNIVPSTYILSADRRLDSDAVPDANDEIEFRRLMHYEDTKKITDLVSRSREIALSQALVAAGRWMSKKALLSANQGTENVHSVYGNVLKHLSVSSVSEDQDIEPDYSQLVRQLNSVEATSAEFAKYELTTPLSTIEFKKALATRNRSKKMLSANLLKPYIESLDSRLKAINPIYQLINRFVLTINALLSDKTIVYKLTQGFIFKNKNGDTLEPNQLSSGEQQLLLLFCNVLVARDTPSVFMIDEPEISLNIKWQRQLIRSLLEIADEARVQFIFASHSIELLSQHRSNVVRLVNEA